MNRSIAELLVDAAERSLDEALGRLEASGFAGLSVSHAFAVQLVGSGVDTITTLSSAMRMTPQAVSAIVNQLEARGYLVRARRETDARAKVLTLTEQGGRLVAAIADSLREVDRSWADILGEERLAEVKAAVDGYLAADARSTALEPKRRRRVRVI